MPMQDITKYDTLSVIHTMLQDSTIHDMLNNADTKRSYRDSLYLAKDGLSDSILLLTYGQTIASKKRLTVADMLNLNVIK